MFCLLHTHTHLFACGSMTCVYDIHTNVSLIHTHSCVCLCVCASYTHSCVCLCVCASYTHSCVCLCVCACYTHMYVWVCSAYHIGMPVMHTSLPSLLHVCLWHVSLLHTYTHMSGLLNTHTCVCVPIVHTCVSMTCVPSTYIHTLSLAYGVATLSRLLKIIGLFCKRALEKRWYFAKETYHLNKR